MSNLKYYAAAALAFVTTLGGLDASQVVNVFPSGWAGPIVSFLAGCAFVAHLFKGVSNSATPKPPDATTPPQALVPLLLIASVATIAMGMTSCVTTTSTAPDGTVTETRSFLTTDEIKALSDAAAAMKQPGQLVTASGK